MFTGKKKILLISLILSIILMYLALRNVDLQILKLLFINFNYKIIVPSFFIVFIMYVIHGLRWAHISSDSSDKKYKNYILITFVGFALNSLIPMRIGDIVKIIISKSYLSKEYSEITSTILFAQYLDFLFVLISFSTILLLLPELYINDSNISILNENIYILLIATIFISTFLIFLLPYISKILIFFQNTLKLKRNDFMYKFLNYFLNVSLVIKELIQDYNKLYKNVILTILYWILIFLLFLIVAYGFEINIPIKVLFFSILLSNLVSIFPVTPSSIGTFHVAIMFGLLLWSDDQNISFAYATTVHGLIFLSNIILGSVALILLNSPFKMIFSNEKK